MAISSDKCCVGVVVNSDCFKLHFTKSLDLIVLLDLPPDDQRVIKLRVNSEGVKTICAHHYAIYYDYYDSPRFHYAKNCCDPFKKHKRVVRGTYKINLAFSDKVHGFDNSLRLIPGKTLCPRCSTQLHVLSSEPKTPRHETSEENDTNECVTSPFIIEKIITPRRVIDTLSSATVMTPIVDLDKSNSERRSRICASVLENLKRNILSQDDSSSSLKPSDFLELMEAVKEKIKSTADRSLQLSLLTLAPASWTLKQTSTRVEKKSGILAKPEAKISSRRLSDDDKQRVIDFYISDEYSRQLPGMKSVKSVKQADGKRLKVQKRLLLLNIDELHGEYKKKFKDIVGIKTVGFSAFADLRPKHVITVGSSGTHSVCVCVYHQNVKLMLSSIGLGEERHLLMDKVVCSVYNKTCMLSGCPNCPGSNALESFLEELICDENENISYKQWTHTDGKKLETIVAASDDFIESLVSAIKKLTTHHFIARNQSAFFEKRKKFKEKIDHESCVLVSDFSENYSFIIQDSVQGYYWANDQATILPFMAYMKRPDGSNFNVSIAITSDHLTHDTIIVHAYLRPVLQHLMTLNPTLKSVQYFTDGSGAQYKNKKNFANLCAHFEDFKLQTEWHFFASCHGKSACDGIGGTVKRLARLASLQRSANNQITSPMQLFNWAKENLEIKCFFVTSEEVKANEAVINERMQNAIAVTGTRKFHSYVPVNSFQVNASILSGDDADFATFNVLPKPHEVFDFFSCNINYYIACIHPDDKYWYVTQIVSLDEEKREFNVNVLSPGGELGFIREYKSTNNQKVIPLSHVIIKIQSLKPTTLRNRIFKLPKSEHDSISAKYTCQLANLE
ncbi:hypothetical protein DAPPUDRAFT_108106 [Daphnia pulex]|uniref:Cc8L18.2-like protein n=1 Tax=Daphnia pulex TaxID=6669 RepID=E9GZ68_DAPPU|nr:hypothetical protein DAPPUDRAFT_108106 [Daphnia pulex]|eukprot:EFX75283.1 hypothetical protein DAPPUDRAFT_108106 [Daphnia pulex]